MIFQNKLPLLQLLPLFLKPGWQLCWEVWIGGPRKTGKSGKSGNLFEKASFLKNPNPKSAYGHPDSIVF